MKLNEIQDLIKLVAKSGVDEVELQTKDIKLLIKAPSSGKSAKAAAAQEQPVIIQTTAAPQAAPVAVPTQQPAQQPTTPPPAAEKPVEETSKAAVEDDSKYVTIKSPMIGTMYRASGPDKDAFVNVGDEVKPGKVICIIEAMKLFNEIEAEISGKIVKVLVDDSSPVEYDQPLFLVDPS